MDEFDRQLNKLFTSRAFVENRLNNESDQMELAIRQTPETRKMGLLGRPFAERKSIPREGRFARTVGYDDWCTNGRRIPSLLGGDENIPTQTTLFVTRRTK